MLSKDGKLKDDLDDNEDEYFDAEQHYAVDRKGIMAHLTSLIADDITQDYVVCEYNGETITVKGHDDGSPRLCYPVQTHSQQRSGRLPMTEPTKPTMSGGIDIRTGNYKARSIERPKFLKPSKRDLSKYACFFPGANLDSIQ